LYRLYTRIICPLTSFNSSLPVALKSIKAKPGVETLTIIDGLIAMFAAFRVPIDVSAPSPGLDGASDRGATEVSNKQPAGTQPECDDKSCSDPVEPGALLSR